MRAVYSVTNDMGVVFNNCNRVCNMSCGPNSVVNDFVGDIGRLYLSDELIKGLTATISTGIALAYSGVILFNFRFLPLLCSASIF